MSVLCDASEGQSISDRCHKRTYVMAYDRRRRPRAKLTAEIIAEIRRRLSLGHYQHDIAADLGINQGRISEVNTGKR